MFKKNELLRVHKSLVHQKKNEEIKGALELQVQKPISSVRSIKMTYL